MKSTSSSSKGPWIFLTGSGLLFVCVFSFFSFSSPLAGVKKGEVKATQALVTEQLLTPLEQPQYNYSLQTGRLGTRGGPNYFSMEYHYVFELNEQPVCKKNRKQRTLCGQLYISMSRDDEPSAYPVEVNLSQSKVRVEYESAWMAPDQWLERWGERISTEKAALKKRREAENFGNSTDYGPIKEIRMPNSVRLKRLEAEKLSVPEEK